MEFDRLLERLPRVLPFAARYYRLPISRLVCKVKMSQDKDPETQRRVIDALRAPGRYHNPRLAEEVERALGRR